MVGYSDHGTWIRGGVFANKANLQNETKLKFHLTFTRDHSFEGSRPSSIQIPNVLKFLIFLIFFSEKARLLESVGAKGAIVIDNNKDTSSTNSPLFAMSGDGTDDVRLSPCERSE